LGLGAAACEVKITLQNEEKRKQISFKEARDKVIECPLYFDGESVRGKVNL
jgi:vacuolar protein sorting-associated protein 26